MVVDRSFAGVAVGMETEEERKDSIRRAGAALFPPETAESVGVPVNLSAAAESFRIITKSFPSATVKLTTDVFSVLE